MGAPPLLTINSARRNGLSHRELALRLGAVVLALLLLPFALAFGSLAATSAQAQQPVPPPPTNLDPSVYVVSYVEVAPAAQAQAATALKQQMEASRKDAGVLNFDVVQRTVPTNHAPLGPTAAKFSLGAPLTFVKSPPTKMVVPSVAIAKTMPSTEGCHGRR